MDRTRGERASQGDCHGHDPILRWGRLRGCLLGLLLCLLPALATGQSTPRAHDGGFFMRLAAGGGAATSKLERGTGAFAEFSGSCVDLNVALGGIVRENLALHATLTRWVVSEPDLEISDVGSGRASGNLAMSCAGVGLTYYFMPANIYVSGKFGAARIRYDSFLLHVSTDFGVATEVSLGKEWWVGDRWGLGVAAALNYHSIPDGEADLRWKGTALTVRFSVTQN